MKRLIAGLVLITGPALAEDIEVTVQKASLLTGISCGIFNAVLSGKTDDDGTILDAINMMITGAAITMEPLDDFKMNFVTLYSDTLDACQNDPKQSFAEALRQGVRAH